MSAFITMAALLALLTVALLARARWWPAAVSADMAAPHRPSRALLGGMAVFVLAVATLGYYRVGSPAQLALGPQASLVAREAAAAAPAAPVGPEQVRAMVANLAERLKAQPGDAEGWMMLARSYIVLGQHADAVKAYRQAANLRPNDAALLADMAFALAVANDRKLGGEPTQLLDRALSIDPQNAKALALAGSAAFERKDYAVAVAHWEQLARTQPADAPFAQQIREGIAKARRLGGLGS